MKFLQAFAMFMMALPLWVWAYCLIKADSEARRRDEERVKEWEKANPRYMKLCEELDKYKR